MYILVQLKMLLLRISKPDTIKKLCVTEECVRLYLPVAGAGVAHNRRRRYRPDGGRGAATWCPERYALYIDESKS